MTGGPSPVAGRNPYTLAYQTSQFDSSALPIIVSAIDVLANPPASGIAAETSPDHVFLENTNPPIGAGGNEPGGGY